MSLPSLVADHLHVRNVRYRLRHHRKGQTAATIASRAQASGVRFGKVVVAIVDAHPVLFVMRAHEHLDEALARAEIGARELRLASPADMERYFPGVDTRATPPLRLWDGVSIWMDRTLRQDGPFLFQAGSRNDAIEMEFADWLRIAEPQIGQVVRPCASPASSPPAPAVLGA